MKPEGPPLNQKCVQPWHVKGFPVCVCVWQQVVSFVKSYLVEIGSPDADRSLTPPPHVAIGDTLPVVDAPAIVILGGQLFSSSSYVLTQSDAPGVKYGFSRGHLSQPETCQARRGSGGKSNSSSICAGCRKKTQFRILFPAFFLARVGCFFYPASPHR